jgi:hypothetical protein
MARDNGIGTKIKAAFKAHPAVVIATAVLGLVGVAGIFLKGARCYQGIESCRDSQTVSFGLVVLAVVCMWVAGGYRRPLSDPTWNMTMRQLFEETKAGRFRAAPRTFAQRVTRYLGSALLFLSIWVQFH